MPEFGGRHYMNPAYGRALALPPADEEDHAQEAARNGHLKRVDIHIQKEGGFSVHAHYQHPRAGHHSVESRHASAADAAEEAQRHLRGHELKHATGGRSSAACSDDSAD
ncbi:MAG TPA: hypothetical protein VEG63_09130 [Candidatus Acidoferrales bacterium]|nr:hypothetical protein [Candidatus Acidoferrales bacterium]